MSAGTVRIGALTTALIAACIAFQLNASMLSPALVTMAGELNTDEATIGLSQTVFFTCAALFSLFLPRLSDIIGRKRVLFWMLGIMLVGSVIAALAVNVEMLFAGRIIQGVTGPVVPICLMMLRHEVSDPKKYGGLLGLLTAINGGIAGVDAIAGGWLAAHFGFRSIFVVIAVITAIAMVFVLLFAVESSPSAGRRMDWLGVVPLVVSVGAVLFAFNEAGKLAAANWMLVIGLLVVGAIAFAIFWRTESRVSEPLMPTPLLARRSTWAVLATSVLTMTGVFAVANGLVVSLAQNTQDGFGMTADVSALVFLTTYALAGWLVGPFSGRIAPVLGYRAVLRIGLAGSVVAVLAMALVGVHSLPVMIIATILLGVMYAGTANIMLNGLGIVLSPSTSPGFLPGLNAGALNLGAGISFAVLPAVQVALGGTEAGTVSYTGAMIAGAVVTAAAFAVSFLIPRPADAESSDAPLEAVAAK